MVFLKRSINESSEFTSRITFYRKSSLKVLFEKASSLGEPIDRQVLEQTTSPLEGNRITGNRATRSIERLPNGNLSGNSSIVKIRFTNRSGRRTWLADAVWQIAIGNRF